MGDGVCKVIFVANLTSLRWSWGGLGLNHFAIVKSNHFVQLEFFLDELGKGW